MKGILSVFLTGLVVCTTLLMVSTYFTEALVPFVSMLTGLGMLTAWLIASDARPSVRRDVGSTDEHKQAA